MQTNDWKELVTTILRDHRTSGYILQRDHGISQVAIHQIVSGKTKKPQQRTIKKLEDALGIVIHDEDPSRLSYSKVADKPEKSVERKFHTYKLQARFDSVDVREEAYE